MGEIIKLSTVSVNERCPSCANPYMTRKAELDEGVALFDLTERCSMCGWKKHHRNVKAG